MKFTCMLVLCSVLSVDAKSKSFRESNPSVSTANKYRFKECMHAEIVTEHVVNEVAKKDPTISKKDRNKMKNDLPKSPEKLEKQRLTYDYGAMTPSDLPRRCGELLLTWHFGQAKIDAKGVLGIVNALRATKNGVRSLKLQNHQIGDEGAGHLADFLLEGHQIVSIDIMSNGIGPAGAKRLAEALKKNNHLSKLAMSKNEMGPEGGAAIAEALKTNKGLEELVFGFNEIGNDGMEAFAEAIKVNTGLTKGFFGQNGITNKKVMQECLAKIRDNKFRKENSGRSRAEMAALDEL